MAAQGSDEIVITDARCCDCGGEVTYFAVPDKVWAGLGLDEEWICMGCLARRLDPEATAETLGEEIRRRRRRFKLSRHRNRYCGAWLNHCGLAVAVPAEESVARLTMAQAGRRRENE